MEITKQQAEHLIEVQRKGNASLDSVDVKLRSDMLKNIPSLRDTERDSSLNYWLDNVQLANIAIPDAVRPSQAIRRFGEIGAQSYIAAFYQAYAAYRSKFISDHAADLRKMWAKWAVQSVDADLVNEDEKPTEGR